MMNCYPDLSSAVGLIAKRTLIICSPPLLLLGSALALYQITSSHSFQLLPRNVEDFNLSVTAVALLAGFSVAFWQTVWLLIACYAKLSNSINAAHLVHKHGPKWANLFLVSSLSLGVACGGCATEASASAPSPIKTTSYQVAETQYTDTAGEVAGANSKSIEISDLRWGTTLVSSLQQPETPEEYTEPTRITYTVQRGDSLWKIASRHLNDHTTPCKNLDIQNYVVKIYLHNREVIGSDPNLIVPGMQIALPPVKETAR